MVSNIEIRLTETGKRAIHAICQAVCDEENQPHQWMGAPELVEQLILAAIGQMELYEIQTISDAKTWSVDLSMSANADAQT